MDDGSLALMSFAVRSRSPTLPPGAVWLSKGQGLWHRQPTDENIKAEIAKTFPGINRAGIKRPKPVAFRVISEAALPADRYYRNAWEIDGNGRVAENLEKAKAIHRDKLRNRRTEKMLPLDIQWSYAMANGRADLAAEAEAKRQALRDITEDPRIDAAKSIDELKRITL